MGSNDKCTYIEIALIISQRAPNREGYKFMPSQNGLTNSPSHRRHKIIYDWDFHVFVSEPTQYWYRKGDTVGSIIASTKLPCQHSLISRWIKAPYYIIVLQATPLAERGNVWFTVTIKLLPRQKLAVTNEIQQKKFFSSENCLPNVGVSLME